MTAVHVHLTVPQRGTTDRLPAAGLLNVSLYRRQAEADRWVLTQSFAQVLVDGQATLQLTPTSAGSAWVVEERVKAGKTRLVSVPDATGTLEYNALPDLDPATLLPSVDSVPAWTAAVAATTAARDQALAAAGPSGTSAQKAANLADLTSAAAARINLGLGDAALHAASDFDLAGAASAAAAGKVNSSTYVAGLAGKADRWQPNTAYTAGQQVQAPDGSTVQANQAFTSGVTYVSSNWTVLVPTAASVAATYVALRGPWTAGTAYSKNSLVIQGGAVYLAAADVPVRTSFAATDWQALGGGTAAADLVLTLIGAGVAGLTGSGLTQTGAGVVTANSTLLTSIGGGVARIAA